MPQLIFCRAAKQQNKGTLKYAPIMFPENYNLILLPVSTKRFQENKLLLLWLKHHFDGSFPLKWLITIKLPFQPLH